MAFRASWNPEDLVVCRDMSRYTKRIKNVFFLEILILVLQAWTGMLKDLKAILYSRIFVTVIFISLISSCLKNYQRIRLLIPPLK